MKSPVLLVEDTDDDIILTTRAWQLSQIDEALRVVRDGQAALDYLAGLPPYVAGANAFLVKPSDADHLVDIVRRIQEFWLGVNRYPTIREWKGVLASPGASR